MTEHVAETRAAYDTVAVAYEEQLRDALAGSPWDRAVLGMVAELVGPSAPMVDLGCGPGRITAYLAGLGLAVSGVDLSPGMIEVARRTHPELRFEVAWYSIIHTPPERLPGVIGAAAGIT